MEMTGGVVRTWREKLDIDDNYRRVGHRDNLVIESMEVRRATRCEVPCHRLESRMSSKITLYGFKGNAEGVPSKSSCL